MADWIPIETDFIITGKDAEELAASPDPGVKERALRASIVSILGSE